LWAGGWVEQAQEAKVLEAAMADKTQIDLNKKRKRP
jgi:hypothetical protein